MQAGITLEIAAAILGMAAIVYAWISSSHKRDDEITDRLVRLETKMDNLTADVEKHNSIVERTYKTEADVNTAFKRIERIEGVKIGGTE